MPSPDGLIPLVGVDAASGITTFSIFKECYNQNILGVPAADAGADAGAEAGAADSATEEVAAKANSYLSDV